jgi:tetratricopeptide (TPR) repeat protein
MIVMSQATAHIEVHRPAATAGDIAAINLESARQRSWNRFWRAPQQPQIAELIVEQEQLTAQFIGDLTAFDRLEMLVIELARAETEPGRTALIAAQVACSVHRFAEARESLALAVARGATTEATDRLLLTLDQATGVNLSAVLAERRERAARPGHWVERIPLGALLADLGEFEEADRTYVEALRTFPDVSPFAPAWASFQLGVLWGECVPDPEPERAAKWYRTAIDYLPGYVKARVHLAEIYLDEGRLREATGLLAPVLESRDPEVSWRLADIAEIEGDADGAAVHLAAARAGFEALVARHPLAFADHGAEFYSGSGGDPARAFELAKLNLANRPTLRAFEQVYSAALVAGEADAAARLRADACERWGSTAAFRVSSLAMHVTTANARSMEQTHGWT